MPHRRPRGWKNKKNPELRSRKYRCRAAILENFRTAEPLLCLCAMIGTRRLGCVRKRDNERYFPCGRGVVYCSIPVAEENWGKLARSLSAADTFPIIIYTWNRRRLARGWVDIIIIIGAPPTNDDYDLVSHLVFMWKIPVIMRQTGF